MDRSLYPDGVEVNSQQLTNTEESKRFHVQRRTVDMTTPGRVSGGLEITVSGSPQYRFNLSAGSAYDGRGDFISSDGTSNLALADYTEDAVNYICLIYREEASEEQAHEADGTSQNTLVTRSSEIRALTQTEYDALSASHDADLETDLLEADLTTEAQNRIVILAKVLGKGYSGGTPVTYSNNDFGVNIFQEDSYTTILSAVAEGSPTPGFNIMAVSDGTPVGSGELVFTRTSATVVSFTWAAPDGAGGIETAGTAKSSPGDFAITDVSAELTLASGDDPTRTITIEVFPSLFPYASSFPDSNTNSIVITELYGPDGPIFSTEDAAHRQKLGSYSPNVDNPHGEGYRDIAQEVAVIPKSLHVGSELVDALVQALAARITSPQTTAFSRVCHMDLPYGALGNFRVYTVSTGVLEFSLNARFDGTTWTRDVNSTAHLWVFNDGLTQFNKTSTATPWAENGWDDVVMENRGALSLGSGILSSAGQNIVPRISAPRPAGGAGLEKIPLAQSRLAAGTGMSLNIYFATEGLSADTPAIDLVVNGRWTTSSTWDADDTGQPMVLLEIAQDGVGVYSTNTNSVANDPGSWTELFRLDPGGSHVVTGDLALSDTLTVGTDLDTTADTPRIRFGSSLDFTSTDRHLLEEATANATFSFRKYVVNDGSNFSFEESINCYWNPGSTRWEADATAGAAMVIRRGTGGTLTLIKEAPLGTDFWNDTVGVGGWTRQYGENGRAVAAGGTDLGGIVHADMRVCAQMCLNINAGAATVTAEDTAINFDLGGISYADDTQALTVNNAYITIPFITNVENPVLQITNGSYSRVYTFFGADELGNINVYGDCDGTGVTLWASQTWTQDFDGTTDEDDPRHLPLIDWLDAADGPYRIYITVFGKLVDP